MFRAASTGAHRPPSGVEHPAGDGQLFLVTFILFLVFLVLVIIIEVILIFVAGPVFFVFIGGVVEVLDVIVVVEVVIGENLMLGLRQRGGITRELALGGLVPFAELLGIDGTTGLVRTIVGHGRVGVS